MLYSVCYLSQRLTLWYFVFLYLIFLSQQVLYFLLSTLVLTLYIDVVLSLSIGMFINTDISWDFHIQNRCKEMLYPLPLLKRLGATFPQNLLLQVYKSYIQPKVDYGLTVYGCTTQGNLYLVQRLQNHAARLILGNFDNINFRGIELVKSPGI